MVIVMQIEISKTQAREIAFSIAADVAEYIATHEEEYRLFLLNEQVQDEH